MFENTFKPMQGWSVNQVTNWLDEEGFNYTKEYHLGRTMSGYRDEANVIVPIDCYMYELFFVDDSLKEIGSYVMHESLSWNRNGELVTRQV